MLELAVEEAEETGETAEQGVDAAECREHDEMGEHVVADAREALVVVAIEGVDDLVDDALLLSEGIAPALLAEASALAGGEDLWDAGDGDVVFGQGLNHRLEVGDDAIAFVEAILLQELATVVDGLVVDADGQDVVERHVVEGHPDLSAVGRSTQHDVALALADDGEHIGVGKGVAGIHEHHIVARSQTDAFVHGVVDACVFLRQSCGDDVAVGSQQLLRVVSAGSVDDDGFLVGIAQRADALQCALQSFGIVASDNDDGVFSGVLMHGFICCVK